MLDQSAWDGVNNLLDDYLGVTPSDYVVIAYTPDSRMPAAWVSVALIARGIKTERIWMAALEDETFLGRFTSLLPAPAELAGRLIVLTLERDTMSHSRAFASVLSTYEKDKCLLFRAIGASSYLFSQAFRVSPADLTARNTALLERCMRSDSLRITTNSGTDLRVTLDNKRHRWISNRGSARPGGTVVLPAGEVATYPVSISGLFVADFAFNVNAITEQDARLDSKPVSVWVEDGRAIKFECGDSFLNKFLGDCFQTYCAYNVGELGFGTNSGVDAAISMNSHINERRPGVHLGFGQHNQDPGVVPYQCAIHLDLIARGGKIWFDDDPNPLDLESITPSHLMHPNVTRDEDVFSPSLDELEVDDCCGILTSDGLRLYTFSKS